MKNTKLTRRNFLGATGAAITLFNIVPSYAIAKRKRKPVEKLPPSERLNFAAVGAGGRAGSNIRGCAMHNIVALCDVDQARAAGSFNAYPDAKQYSDWRRMFDKEAKNIDGVIISTPDHCHAVVALAAMQLGKAVYVEKPLTRTIEEARTLKEAAKRHGVATQMGNQGHAAEGARLCNEWIQSGAIGEVREIYTSTNRPIWPQDVVRPPEEPVPETINWDVWLGPAPVKPYSSLIAPFKWRGYWDYGAGALGDMGAHIIDHPMWALDLGLPDTVEVLKVERNTPGSEKDTFPQSTIVEYKFPARGKLPPVTMKWFDGNFSPPPHPEKLEPERTLGKNGSVFFGSKYHMMMGSHGKPPRIFPESDMKEFPRPEPFLERSPGHYVEWHNAIKQNDPSLAKSNFEYAAKLTEVMLLACIATRAGEGTKITWDAKNMKSNNDEVNRYIAEPQRKGWELGKVG